MYVITGGAGFIGSNIAAALDASGDDIVIVDWLRNDPFKWRNIAKRRLADLVAPEHLAAFLEANRSKIQGIVHMGAISTTTELDVDAIVRNNFRLSVDLWRFCAAAGLPLVYASSGATYGDGAKVFSTDSTRLISPGSARSTLTAGASMCSTASRSEPSRGANRHRRAGPD